MIYPNSKHLFERKEDGRKVGRMQTIKYTHGNYGKHDQKIEGGSELLKRKEL